MVPLEAETLDMCRSVGCISIVGYMPIASSYSCLIVKCGSGFNHLGLPRIRSNLLR